VGHTNSSVPMYCHFTINFDTAIWWSLQGAPQPVTQTCWQAQVFLNGNMHCFSCLGNEKPKVYRGSKKQLHSFLTSALDRGQWSTTHSDRFAHGKELPVSDGFQSGLARFGLRNILCSVGKATSQLATHNCARSNVTRPTCWHSATAHNYTLISHWNLQAFLNPIAEHSFSRQYQTALTFCISGLKVSVSDIRLSLLNANEGAAQHTQVLKGVYP